MQVHENDIVIAVTLLKINFDQDLDEQGCFDAVIHKLTDMMIDAMDGNDKAAKNLHKFQVCLCRKHHFTIVLQLFFYAIFAMLSNL